MRLSRLRPALLAFLSASMLGPGAVASQSRPIRWTISAPERLVEQGHAFRVFVHADIPKGTHLYALTQRAGGPMAATIIADSGGAFALAGAVVARTADHAIDRSFGFATETYSDSVTFTVPIVTQQSGVDRLMLIVHYQSCTDIVCLPPKRAEVSLLLSIAPGSAIASQGYSILPAPPRRRVDADTDAAMFTGAADSNPSVDVRALLARALWIAFVLGAVVGGWVLFKRRVRK